MGTSIYNGISRASSERLNKTLSIIMFLSAPLALGMLSVFFGRAYAGFSGLETPRATAPDMVYSIVWPIMFLLSGISVLLVTSAPTKDRHLLSYKKLSITLWFLTLVLNVSWIPAFFAARALVFSFIWISLLFSLSVMLVIINLKIRKSASFVLIPYTLWIGYLAYINLFAAIMNVM